MGRKDPPLQYEGSGKFPETGLYDTAVQWNVRCTWADGLVMDFMDSGTYAALPGVPHPEAIKPLHNGAHLHRERGLG